MRYVAVIILHAFVAQAQSEKRQSNHGTDRLLDHVANDLIDNMVGREFKEGQVYHLFKNHLRGALYGTPLPKPSKHHADDEAAHSHDRHLGLTAAFPAAPLKPPAAVGPEFKAHPLHPLDVDATTLMGANPLLLDWAWWHEKGPGAKPSPEEILKEREKLDPKERDRRNRLDPHGETGGRDYLGEVIPGRGWFTFPDKKTWTQAPEGDAYFHMGPWPTMGESRKWHWPTIGQIFYFIYRYVKDFCFMFIGPGPFPFLWGQQWEIPSIHQKMDENGKIYNFDGFDPKHEKDWVKAYYEVDWKDPNSWVNTGKTMYVGPGGGKVPLITTPTFIKQGGALPPVIDYKKWGGPEWPREQEDFGDTIWEGDTGRWVDKKTGVRVRDPRGWKTREMLKWEAEHPECEGYEYRELAAANGGSGSDLIDPDIRNMNRPMKPGSPLPHRESIFRKLDRRHFGPNRIEDMHDGGWDR